MRNRVRPAALERHLSVARQSANSMPMKFRPARALNTCPNCGVRLVPTPKELRLWREAAGFNQREMAKYLN